MSVCLFESPLLLLSLCFGLYPSLLNLSLSIPPPPRNIPKAFMQFLPYAILKHWAIFNQSKLLSTRNSLGALWSFCGTGNCQHSRSREGVVCSVDLSTHPELVHQSISDDRTRVRRRLDKEGYTDRVTQPTSRVWEGLKCRSSCRFLVEVLTEVKLCITTWGNWSKIIIQRDRTRC